jgi:N-acetylglucosaminyldiphosphoundecaprenol N-acetyl-beta-D-mannosaminyltransferase
VDFVSKISGSYEFEPGIYTFLNPYSVGFAIDNDSIFSKFDKIYIDGIALKLALNALGVACEKRISFDFTSIANQVFRESSDRKLKVALIGSTEAQIEAASLKLTNLYPRLNIEITRNGYFKSDNEITNLVTDIIDKRIDVVICGMGTLLQENFLINLTESNWNGYGYTCGGFLHQTAEGDDYTYYPKWMNKLNIRFIYRAYKEPKLLKRYLINYPKNITRLVLIRTSKCKIRY